MKINNNIIITLLAFVLLSSIFAVDAYGQQIKHPETVVCPTDGYVNEWSSNFCIKDGTSLAATKNKILEELLAATTKPVRKSKPALLEVGMSRIFHLRDENIINGTIIEMEGDSIAIIETAEGILRVPAIEILEEMADLVKLDGTHFLGPILSEDAFSITIKTPYGVAVVLKEDIRSMDRYYGDKKVSWTEEKRRFLSGDNVIDIFLDPTAFPLKPNVVYLSGFSIGYGFTESFMLRTEFGRDIIGDLNLHPLFRLYHRSTGKSETALSLGFRLFSRHEDKVESQRYSHWIVNKDDNDKRLDDENSDDLDNILIDSDKRSFFATTYLVLSKKQSLKSGRGKWGWHLGFKTDSYIFSKPKLASEYEWDSAFKLPYRIWGGMDYDLTKKLKFLIEVYADNGHKFIDLEESIDSYFDFGGTPFTVDTQRGEYRPVDLDFGFTYAVNDALRLGAHFQAPYLTIYWKFYQF